MVDVASPIQKKITAKSRLSWARLVSDIISPPIVWAILVIPVAFQYAQSTVNAIFWAVLYGIFICLLPILYVAYQVWRGNISDIHMKNRRHPSALSVYLVYKHCLVVIKSLRRTACLSAISFNDLASDDPHCCNYIGLAN